MKTKAQRKDIKEKDEATLVALLAETRESIRKSRFTKAGTPGATSTSPAAGRKLIARIETELRARRAKTA